MSSHLGMLLRERRRSLGLTLYEVSDLMGFSNVFLCRIERGDRKLSPLHVKKISKILKVSEEKILRALAKDDVLMLRKKAQ